MPDLIDAVCDRFEDGWLAGTPPPLEDLVRSAPDPARADLFRELLLLELDYRRKAGRPLPPDEGRDRFAGLGTWAAVVLDDLLPVGPAVVLEVVRGPAAGRTFPLTGPATLTVGRRTGLQVNVPADKYLSRVHCVIEVDPPAVRVVDLGSKGGTFVNGRRVTEQDLRPGDEVTAGATTLRVRGM